MTHNLAKGKKCAACRRVGGQTGALLLLILSLAGCAGIDAVADSVSGLNPFAKEEEKLPGERRDAVPLSDPVLTGTVQSASIGPARALTAWNNPGGDEANNPGHVSLAGGALTRAWSASAAEVRRRRALRAFAAPVVDEGRVYTYDPEGNATAVSVASGSRLWRVSLKPEVTREAANLFRGSVERQPAPGGGIASGGGFVYVATGYGQIVGLVGGTGQKVWTHDLGEPARSAPTYAAGRVFVVTASNEIVALSAADGAVLWSYLGIPESARLLASSSPAVSGSTVVAPSSSGEIIALDAESGDPKWSDAVVRAGRRLAVSGLTDVAGSPVIAEGVVFAAGVAGRTIAVSLKSGERLWERNIGSSYTPIVSGNAVFLLDLSDRMIALDRQSGKSLWAVELPVIRKKRSRTTWAGPVLAGGALWAASSDGQLIQVDAANGQILTTKDIGKKVYLKPIAASSRLFVLAGDGTMLAFN